jgi:transcriptional regulator with XRE-family HTH domain
MAKIGEKIRARRKQLGLSQESLAERLHISRQTISSWENGKSAIKLENAKPLSDELEIPLDEF